VHSHITIPFVTVANYILPYHACAVFDLLNMKLLWQKSGMNTSFNSIF
jgi:hypothetical protein